MEESKGPRTIFEAFAQTLKKYKEEAEYWRKVAEGYEETIQTLAAKIAKEYKEEEEADVED